MCVGARTHTIKIETRNVVLGRIQTPRVVRLRSNADACVTADIDDVFPHGLSQENSEG